MYGIEDLLFEVTDSVWFQTMQGMYGHLLDQHFHVPDRHLVKIAIQKKVDFDSPKGASVFDISEKEALALIGTCVKEEIETIKLFAANDNERDMELYFDTEVVIGHGFIKGTDLRYSYNMTALVIILRKFKDGIHVYTAYPVVGNDSIDQVFDDMEYFLADRMKK